jgi:hypothetical protein
MNAMHVKELSNAQHFLQGMINNVGFTFSGGDTTRVAYN